MIKNNKTPSSYNKNKDIKVLDSWLSHQQTNYKTSSLYNKTKDIKVLYQWLSHQQN